MVDHDLLLDKLRVYGVPGDLLCQWRGTRQSTRVFASQTWRVLNASILF